MVTSWESIKKVFPLQEESLAGSPLRMCPDFTSPVSAFGTYGSAPAIYGFHQRSINYLDRRKTAA